MPETCPVCDSPHDTYGGVAMHMVKMGDEEHDEWETKDGALEHLSAEGLIGVGSSGEGATVDTSDADTSATSEPDTSETAADGGNPLIGDGEPDEPDTAADTQDSEVDCCDDPTTEPAEGVYALENGEHVRADGDDLFCQSCGALIENDGTVMR